MPRPCIAPTASSPAARSTSRRHVRELEATNPNTLFVSAGDLIGATPLVSALFHDEPTIEAFNLMGLDFNGVGNHEFDEGVDELLRMQNGGCHPVDGCQDGDPFAGADFTFLAANVAYKDTRRDDLPALRDQALQRRQGRDHRHDARGHAARSSPRPASRPSTSSTRPTASTRWSRCSSGRASRRSSCCSTRAARRATRSTTSARSTPAATPVRPSAADRRAHGRRDRRRRHRPHQLGGQLRRRRQGRHRRGATRAASSPTST